MTQNNKGTPHVHDSERRRLLTGLAGAGMIGAGMATTSLLAADAYGQHVDPPADHPSADWGMMFEINVRFPPGRLQDWNSFWGDLNVPLLEKNGQWLWGAFLGLSGLQNTATHLWAYHDLAHYQRVLSGGANRDPRIKEVLPKSVPIEESIYSSVMVPTLYHPKKTPDPLGKDSVIVTHRILPSGAAGNVPEHVRLAQEYIPLAEKQGAQLLGAFSTFFGWSPSYMLQIWRYRDIKHYFDTRRAIEADVQASKLLIEMRKLVPRELVELHQPTPYSRIR